jgi:hypothetical protein
MLQLRFAVDAMYTASFKAEHTFQNRETVQESKTNLGPGPTIRNVRPKQLRKHDRSRLIESISGVQQQGHVRLRQFEHIVLLVPQSGCRLPNKKARVRRRPTVWNLTKLHSEIGGHERVSMRQMQRIQHRWMCPSGQRVIRQRPHTVTRPEVLFFTIQHDTEDCRFPACHGKLGRGDVNVNTLWGHHVQELRDDFRLPLRDNRICAGGTQQGQLRPQDKRVSNRTHAHSSECPQLGHPLPWWLLSPPLGPLAPLLGQNCTPSNWHLATLETPTPGDQRPSTLRCIETQLSPRLASAQDLNRSE